jgi:hydroxypyruvate isomerase
MVGKYGEPLRSRVSRRQFLSSASAAGDAGMKGVPRVRQGLKRKENGLIRLAANLSMMFTEVPFLERFAAAAQAGFRGVEYLFPYDVPAEEIRERLERHGLSQVLFNFPAGDWARGERGIAALPERVDEFRSGVANALHYARATGCRKLHVMPGKLPAGADRETYLDTFVANLIFAADATVADAIDLMIEPINTRVDIPGYLLDRTDLAMQLIARAARPNIRLQFDLYHVQIMEGDLTRSIARLLPSIGHIQLADNPGRNEPGTGEINFDWLLQRIDALGYPGWIGCEYKPRGPTAAGLAWAERFLA